MAAIQGETHLPTIFVSTPPTEILFKPKPSTDESDLSHADVVHIAEIFRTPLIGAYCWDYSDADAKLRRLYEVGKRANWNAQVAFDWSIDVPRNENPLQAVIRVPYEGWAPYDALSDEQKIEFGWHVQSWLLSQFLHGEQGALLVASQLVSCSPTQEAKLYAASQTFDEARHVEVFSRYIMDKVGFMYPVNRHLKALLDSTLSDERWDLKLVGMQIIIEGLALAAFNFLKFATRDPLLQQILEYVMRDEGRHVAYGVNFLESYIAQLTPSEVEERARFAYEACCIMRERIVPMEVYEHFGWDAAEARSVFLAGEEMQWFRKLLFARIIPDLKKIGLLTPTIRPLYAELGVLEYEDMQHDGVIDWENLELPPDASLPSV